MKLIRLLLTALFMFSVSHPSWAICTFDDTGAQVTSTNINIDSPSDVYIGVDYITSQVWGDSSKISQVSNVSDIGSITCTNDWRISVVPALPTVDNGTKMDSTVKSIWLSTSINVSGSTYSINSAEQTIRAGFPVNVTGVGFSMTKSSLVTKGKGVIPGGPIATVKLIEGGNTYDLASININAIDVHAGACTNSTSQNVDMGTHSRSEFTKVGSFTDEVSFNIAVSCDPEIQVYGRFDGVNTNTTGVFGLDSKSTATGVGIQILSKLTDPGVVLQNGVRNKWFGNVPQDNSTINIPFSARYYQIDQTVTPGDADAAVTFTLQYD